MSVHPKDLNESFHILLKFTLKNYNLIENENGELSILALCIIYSLFLINLLDMGTGWETTKI